MVPDPDPSSLGGTTASQRADLYEEERAVGRATAANYDAAYETPYWSGERDAFAARMALHARQAGLNLKDAAVLEVGTGTGLLIPHLYERGFERITGSDISEDMLKHARGRFPSINFQLGPVEELQGSWDVVVGFSVLHHLPDLRSFFSWLSGVLRQGGVFGFADGNQASILQRSALRWVVWGAVFPLHKPLRLINEQLLQAVPKMDGPQYYSSVHRALTRPEILSSLPPTLDAELSTHGILAPTFNNAVVDNRIGRAMMRTLRKADHLLPFEGEELWTIGSKREPTDGPQDCDQVYK